MDSRWSDGTWKALSEKVYLVVEKVYVAEVFLHQHSEVLSRFEELSHSACLLSGDNLPEYCRSSAIEVPACCLGERYGQYELVVHLTWLHVVHHPRLFAEEVAFDVLLCDVVDGESQLLVLFPACIVAAQGAVALLCGYHSAHQLHRRIAFSRIAAHPSAFDHHFAEVFSLSLHHHVELFRGISVNLHSAPPIAFSRHADGSAFGARQCEATQRVGGDAFGKVLCRGYGMGYALGGEPVDHVYMNNVLGMSRYGPHPERQ